MDLELGVVQRLVRDANAKGVFVVDRNGQLISEAGEMRGVDTTSLASLTAGSVAATGTQSAGSAVTVTDCQS